jgi:hypothetical protein
MLARLLIVGGIVLLSIGLALQFAPGLLSWFGRLPGDIHFERDGTRVFIPITSMIIVSLVLTLVVNLLLRR